MFKEYKACHSLFVIEGGSTVAIARCKPMHTMIRQTTGFTSHLLAAVCLLLHDFAKFISNFTSY